MLHARHPGVWIATVCRFWLVRSLLCFRNRRFSELGQQRAFGVIRPFPGPGERGLAELW